MGSYSELLARFASDGLESALLAVPVASFMPADQVRDWVVLSDMRVDPDSGVQVLLTAALVSDSMLLLMEVSPASDAPSDTHVAVRAIPLRHILEVRTVCHSPSADNIEVLSTEFVTAEFGAMRLEAALCGAPVLEGMEGSEEEALSCTESDGFVGDVAMNSVVLSEHAGMSGQAAADDLLRFSASVARLAAQR